jgi:AraC-like DNA-binding protein
MYNVFNVKSSSDWVLPLKSCLINFSVLKEIKASAPFRSFSIKYVSKGCERYTVNGNKYLINSGEYLIANHHAEGIVEIEKEVTGICIDVAPDLLSEAVASYLRPDTMMADRALDIFFNHSDFLENKYSFAGTHVGKFLKQLDLNLEQNPLNGYQLNREFYLLLAEKIVEDHVSIFKQLTQVKQLKEATRKDIVRKIIKSMTHMESCFDMPLKVAEVAAACGMSEYHYFRMFRMVNRISPHQYILQVRLNKAKNLLKKNGVSISEAAYLSGFNDIYTFSKAYKKYFGYSPSLDPELK